MNSKIKAVQAKGLDVIVEMTDGKKILYHPQTHFYNNQLFCSKEFIAQVKVGTRGELIFPLGIDICADSIKYYGEEISP